VPLGQDHLQPVGKRGAFELGQAQTREAGRWGRLFAVGCGGSSLRSPNGKTSETYSPSDSQRLAAAWILAASLRARGRVSPYTPPRRPDTSGSCQHVGLTAEPPTRSTPAQSWRGIGCGPAALPAPWVPPRGSAPSPHRWSFDARQVHARTRRGLNHELAADFRAG